MTAGVQWCGAAGNQASWYLLVSSVPPVGATARPNRETVAGAGARGHRATRSRGPSAGVLGPGWTFLGLPPGPFGRGHLRWNQVWDLGHPLLSLSWGGASCWGRAPCFGASPWTASRSLGLGLLRGEEGRRGSSDSRPSPAANSGAAEPGQGESHQRQGPARPSPPSRGPDFREHQSP